MNRTKPSPYHRCDPPATRSESTQPSPGRIRRGEMERADLIVLGGGSAGFAAAIQADERGAEVILVNAGTLGGTCVNVGCVPSKTLIRAADALHRARHNPFAGMESTARLRDFEALMKQKDQLVRTLRHSKYARVLEARPRVRLVEGPARIAAPDRVDVAGRSFHAPRIVVATGARPWIPPIPGLREVDPLTSATAFELRSPPDSLIVLGGRYIALECAQLFARLGTEVTILQRSDQLLPPEDEDTARALEEYLEAEGIWVHTSVQVLQVEGNRGKVTVRAHVEHGERRFSAERILCATGRRPNTEQMGLEEAGIRLGEDGRILVDEHLQTSVPGIYAAGDVIGEPAFVYTAAYEGDLAARNALAKAPAPRDYAALPWVIFTDPQLAGVGLNEKEAARNGMKVEVSRLDLGQVPRALSARDTRGFIKLLKEHGSDRLLGARILAPEGGEQVMEAALALRHGLGASELASAFHPYLTQAEGIKLCAQGFFKDVSRLSCCST